MNSFQRYLSAVNSNHQWRCHFLTLTIHKFANYILQFSLERYYWIGFDTLPTNIITSLRHTQGSASHFQELELELQTLRRALIEIDMLTKEASQIPEICAPKFASCGCRETLERFWERARLLEESLGWGVWKAARKMTRWEFLVKKEVP
jgi:hypothetical protein